MNPNVKLIVSKIEELVVAVGGKIEAFYPYVLKEQIITGVTLLVPIFLSVVLLLIGLRLGKKSKWDSDEPAWIICVITGGVFAGILGLIFSVHYLPLLLNPHYHAVKDILEMGQSLIK